MVDDAKIRQAIDKAVQDIDDRVNRTVNELKRRQPSDTGRTASQWAVRRRESGNNVEWEIYNPSEVWRYLHEGTGIYGPKGARIEPVSAKALRFKPKGGGQPRRSGSRAPGSTNRGGWVFAKWVRGIPPSDYVVEATRVVWTGVGNINIRSQPGSRV